MIDNSACFGQNSGGIRACSVLFSTVKTYVMVYALGS